MYLFPACSDGLFLMTTWLARSSLASCGGAAPREQSWAGQHALDVRALRRRASTFVLITGVPWIRTVPPDGAGRWSGNAIGVAPCNDPGRRSSPHLHERHLAVHKPAGPEPRERRPGLFTDQGPRSAPPRLPVAPGRRAASRPGRPPL